MTPEFSIQAVKLEANPRTQRPIKYVPDKTTQPPIRSCKIFYKIIKKKNSESMNKRARQTSELKRDDQVDVEQPKEQREQLSVPREQPKQYINMDERYLMYEQEAKKRENMVELNPGVMFYKAVKPDQLPKLPLPKRNSKQVDKQKALNISQQSKTPSQSEKISLDTKEKSISMKSNSKIFSEQFKDLYCTPNAAKQIDPEFLVRGDVDGYKLDESQSQMFSYGLNDYVQSNFFFLKILNQKNHKKDLALKDVADDVKFKPQAVYSHFDYYPGDGTIPKPLLESVNYMNWLKQQEQEQQ